MFDIFDDMDDFELSFDMASESYLDSVDEEINEWEDTAEESVGYDAIKDKVDAALEEFVENAKFAGKVVWSAIKKAAAAVKAFFKALPGRIGKFIRQSIEKIKQKFREGFSREKADDKAKRLAGDLKSNTILCKKAAASLVKIVTQEVKIASVHDIKLREDANKHASNVSSAMSGDSDAYVRIGEIYDKYNKAFNSSFDKVLKSSIGFTKALAKGKTSLASHANDVVSCLGTVTDDLVKFINTLEKGVSAVESSHKELSKDHNSFSAGARTQSKILSQYRSTISSFSAKKDRIDEQLEYINNALLENTKRATSNNEEEKKK